MSDDIVKYLRLSRTRFNRNAEAADEIERLRASVIDTFNNGFDEIERLRKELEIYQDLYANEIVKRVAGE